MAASPGFVTPAMIPSPLLDGTMESANAALLAAGFPQFTSWSTNGFQVSDLPTVQNALGTYTGSAAQLVWAKARLMEQLDAFLDANMQLPMMVRAGTLTTLTGTSVGAFLATAANNYRTLRASIQAAATVAAVNAINIRSGWPANP